jgi:hypothetical protein
VLFCAKKLIEYILRSTKPRKDVAKRKLGRVGLEVSSWDLAAWG